MTADDLRRIALSLPGAEESSHMGQPDFRVGGKIFATLASEAQGYGNLKLTPALQAELIDEEPDIFLPASGGWGRMGITHIRLGLASAELLETALRLAHKLRVQGNQKSRKAPVAQNVNVRARKSKKP